MIGHHITLEGNTVTTDYAIIEHVELGECQDIAFWHWLAHHDFGQPRLECIARLFYRS